MSYTIPFTQLNKTNILTAGGKGANLGEMTTACFPVPPGFVLTTAAYDAFVQAHGLQQQIVELARTVSVDDPQSSEAASAKIRQIFLSADVPADIADAVMAAYADLGEVPVAVRSSATAEDLPEASFAGQHETYLNVQGKDALLEAIKQCWTSLWTARAIVSDRFAETAKRRAEAYEQLLALATQKGKAKQFKKQAALLANAGYRETPKYFFIITVDLMRRRALALGEEFVAQGRLDAAEQVFDLTVDQLTQAQKDSSLDLRSIIANNLAPRAKQAHVREWPSVVDSRGKILRAERTAVKEGELVGVIPSPPAWYAALPMC